ncbi:hypothetical protein ACC691_40995, partial [Rhizobium johnstonii]|uniref:hypothetical protein n=1 Tax=Rhizobium johnstonii TaxID=3019933 RepID=UPI003F9578DA
MFHWAGSTTVTAKSVEPLVNPLPGADYDVVMHSTPVTLTSGVANGTGGIRLGAKLPASVPFGAHTL